MGTYTSENNPECVQSHLATNRIRDGTHEHHGNQLTKGLHGAPESRVVGIENALSLFIDESNMLDEALVGNDVTIQGVLVTIGGSGNRDEVANENSLGGQHCTSRSSRLGILPSKKA